MGSQLEMSQEHNAYNRNSSNNYKQLLALPRSNHHPPCHQTTLVSNVVHKIKRGPNYIRSLRFCRLKQRTSLRYCLRRKQETSDCYVPCTGEAHNKFSGGSSTKVSNYRWSREKHACLSWSLILTCILFLSAGQLLSLISASQSSASFERSQTNHRSSRAIASPSVNSQTYEYHNKSIKEIVELLTTVSDLYDQKESTTPSPSPDVTTTSVTSQSSLSTEQQQLSSTLPSISTDSTKSPHQENHGTSSVGGVDDAENSESLSDDGDTTAKNLTGNEKLVNLQSDIKDQMKDFTKEILREWIDFGYTNSATPKCIATFTRMITGMQDASSWAFKFLDSTAKIPSGLMSGALSDFGDFDQCLAIRTNENISPEEEDEEQGEFSGKYCLVSVQIDIKVNIGPNETRPKGIDEDGVLWDKIVRKYWTSKVNKGFMIGVCLPSKCLESDVSEILNYTVREYDVNASLIDCQKWTDLKHNQKPDFTQVIILIVFGVIFASVLIGTIIHFRILDGPEAFTTLEGQTEGDENELWRKFKSNSEDFFLCFSMVKNWRLFTRQHTSHACQKSPLSSSRRNISDTLSVKIHNLSPIEERNDCLSHLSGLKLLVICWIMMGHSFLYPSANNHQYYRAIASLTTIRDSIWFATTNFTLGIDTLLYMIGFLFVFKIHRAGEHPGPLKSSKMEIFRLIIHKILRFWPTYLSVIGLAIVVPLISDGPLWPEMVERRLGDACRKNWWANILFINNLQDESQICLPSSWFLSIVMQCFFVGSVLLLLARRYSSKIALALLFILLTLSAILSYVHAYVSRIEAPVIRLDESFVMNVNGDVFTLYTRLYNNLGPFLVGMIGGFIFMHEQNKKNSSDRLKQCTTRKKTDSIGRHYGATLLSREHVKSFLKHCFILISITSIAVLVLGSVFPENYSRGWAAFYWAVHRIGWATASGYLIHQIAMGRWRLLKRILSLSTLIPLSRLIFIAYLVYPLFIHIHTGQVRDGLHINTYAMLNIYITRLVLTFGAALVLHLFIELPLCSLEETWINRWIQRILQGHKSPSKFHPLLIVAPVTNSTHSTSSPPNAFSSVKMFNNSTAHTQAVELNESPAQSSHSAHSSLEFTVTSSLGLRSDTSSDKLDTEKSESPGTDITAIEVHHADCPEEINAIEFANGDNSAAA